MSCGAEVRPLQFPQAAVGEERGLQHGQGHIEVKGKVGDDSVDGK